ncbi:MAG: hypothetical protein Q7J84_12485, partial [Sulfuricaulis sp.]|nr:hypothetical protein [Sulfuricaulis sp.]
MKPTPLSPLRKSLLYFALALALFSVFRVAFYITYRDYFSQLPAGQMLWAFVHGVRFDAAIIAIFFIIPILLLNFPLRIAASRLWQPPLAWILWAMTLAMGVVLAVDLVYFGY